MALRYSDTSLWNRTLGRSGNTQLEESALAVLRSTFETAHDRIKPIVQQAHIDCKGLTIHDATHLDALWQMADLIAGDDYVMNPVEAFVFGCSVLFHDAALAVAAYEGGLDALKSTSQWKRTVARLASGSNKSADLQVEGIALFTTLRSLHATQASRLAERQWRKPNSNEFLYIIEDTETRDYYAQIIGRIAQSHHWDIDRVARDFNTRKAPPPNFPAGWELNEVKIACLLRCADAAHIDRRRAPLMDFIIANPAGYSATHWNFQNRLGVPTRGENSIIYNAGRDFGRSEADAWWLCYDTCKMISNELQSSSAILKESDTSVFFANRVEGVERPKLFSKFVRCDGWEPVDAEVRVTDPVHLAETLGGKNLYGPGYHAPVRELLQNAIDATLMRKSIGRDGFSPKIRVTLERADDGRLHLIIEDNGIGMSEHVLTRRLIDFGQSGWRSDDVAHDNPEINAALVNISGKFGIGFFAVFLLGEDITVITRKYNAGLVSGLALEFVGLARRPILRKALEAEQSDIFTTRVVAKLSEHQKNGFLQKSANRRIRRLSYNQLQDIDFIDYIKCLVVSSDVDIELIDKVSNRSFFHHAAWSTRASEELIKDLLGPPDADDNQDFPAVYSTALSNVFNSSGIVIGRAAIKVDNSNYHIRNTSFARVGGLTYPTTRTTRVGPSSTSVVPPFVGIIEGEAVIATRGEANIAVTAAELAKWATKQAEIGLSRTMSVLEQMELSRHVYWAGGDPLTLPLAYLDGKLVSLADLRTALFSREELFLPIEYTSGRSIEYHWLTLQDLRIRYFFDPMSEGTCIMAIENREHVLFSTDEGTKIELKANKLIDEDTKKFFHFGSYALLINLIEKEGRNFTLRCDVKNIIDAGIITQRSAFGVTLFLNKS